MDKRKLREVNVEGKSYYYLDFGSESHGKTSFRLWINRHFVNFIKDEDNEDGIIIPTIFFPIIGATLQQGKSIRTVILRPGMSYVYDIYVPEGYRGYGEVTKWDNMPTKIFCYKKYRSPQGSCGIGRGYLIETLHPKVIYHWKRTGRLYGDSPQGVTIVYADGRKEVAKDIEAEELKELE